MRIVYFENEFEHSIYCFRLPTSNRPEIENVEIESCGNKYFNKRPVASFSFIGQFSFSDKNLSIMAKERGLK